MENLLELALQATRENVVKTTKKENINDALLRILYDEKQKLDRVELVARISLDRLISEYGEEQIQKMVEKDPEKFAKLMKATNKTVKNGVDTSISNSQNNSSFSYNEKYNDYKLELVKGKYQITKRTK